MVFQSIGDIEDALRSQQTSARDLHAIWDQRLPVSLVPGSRSKESTHVEGRQIPWLQDNIALATRFAERALKCNEFLLASDASREALCHWSAEHDGGGHDAVRLRMHFASALTRLGRTRDARGLLQPCLQDDFRSKLGRGLKANLLLQLGDILREESHHAPAVAVKIRTAEESLRFYRHAVDLRPESDNDYLRALTYAAGVSFVIGEPGSPLRDSARELTGEALQLIKKLHEADGSAWRTTWAQAVAHTVLGEIDKAIACYREIQTLDGVTTTDLADIRYRAGFFAEALGQSRDFFNVAFPPLQLIVFAGHLPDRPNKPKRFPQEAIEPIRQAIEKQLERLQARAAVVSAAAGADLLFIDAMLRRKGEVHVVLPWRRDEFVNTSVRSYEPENADPVWEPMFDRAIEESASVREFGQAFAPNSAVGWNYAKEVMSGVALYTARTMRLDIQPVVLWDGLPGRGEGGTSSFVEYWRHELLRDPIHIPLETASTSDRRAGDEVSLRSEQPTMLPHVKTMLFADIVGYSKLAEQVLPEFVETFLGSVSRLISESKHAPRTVNTWGDAVYAVFDFAEDAGLFALELTRMIHEKEKEWKAKGLYSEEKGIDGQMTQLPLNVRVGLHSGPVFLHHDPVVRRLGYTGAHVSRAARIEPVATPGEIFASEEFAALIETNAEIRRCRPGASSQTGEGLVCEYAGTMRLAKNYPGRFRIYRVLPKRVFAVEELAQAVHESFLDECRKRNETPERNSSMVPWSELPEDRRQANRAQVADIPNKLAYLGYELAPSHGLSPLQISISDAQVEALSIQEHDRWMAERRREGWQYGPKRDNARKIHPLLAPWDDLSDIDKDKDRDAVRNLPRLIERAGFRVRRT